MCNTRLLAALLLLSAAGCGGERPDAIDEDGAGLAAFESCDELERYLEDGAVRWMRAQLEEAKDPSGWYAVPRAAGEVNTSVAPPSAYTRTNVQVPGVDEPDFVKNDGTRIFVLSGDQLHLISSWPAAEASERARMTIEGWPEEMFLEEHDRLVVFSGVYQDVPGFEPGALGRAGLAACAPMRCAYYAANTVKVTVIDVADLAHPVVRSELYLPGAYRTARRVGASVRVVTSEPFRWPDTVRWYPDIRSEGDLDAAYDALMEANEAAIRAGTLEGWLRNAERVGAGGEKIALPPRCTDFSRSRAPTWLGMVTVATVRLDAPEDPLSRTTVVAEAGEVYASADALYLATPHWWWTRESGDRTFTYVHKLGLGDPDRTTYLGSGGVPGTVVDQFSMDEHRGALRVATTIDTWETSLLQPWSTETTNRVTVLGEEGGRLVEQGRTEDFAEGERIQAARFAGDRGFVITFRRVDPLFTIDLSSAALPRIAGELTLPGFSTYLHPVDATHLLAIGTHIPDESNPWQDRGIELRIFDVADLARPTSPFVEVIAGSSSWSDAQLDHRAFNWFPERGLLAIPLARWDSGGAWSSFRSELDVFGVDLAAGFTRKGALDMSDLYVSAGSNDWTYYWTPAVRRSVMADDYVYAISDAGLRIARAGALGAPLRTIPFSRSVEVPSP